jgi:hypothetical protein
MGHQDQLELQDHPDHLDLMVVLVPQVYLELRVVVERLGCKVQQVHQERAVALVQQV